MTLALALTLKLSLLCSAPALPSLDLSWLAQPVRELAHGPRLELAAAHRGNPGKLRRIINDAHNMPKHTKLIIGLCVGGMAVFFFGVWMKSRL